MPIIDQKTQIKKSRIYEDEYGSGGQLVSTNSLEDDLNAIRTQIKNIIGKERWYSSVITPSNISLATLLEKDSDIWSTIGKPLSSSFTPDRSLDSFSITGGEGISVEVVAEKIIIKNTQSSFDKVGISSNAAENALASSATSSFKILGDSNNGYIETVSDDILKTITVSYVGPQTTNNSWFYIQSFDNILYKRIFPDAENDTIFIYGRRGLSTSLDTENNRIILNFDQNLREGASPTFGSICLNNKNAGSVLFAGADGEISEDTDNLFFDQNNNFFGIKTNQPEERLHIQDSIIQKMDSGSEDFDQDDQFYGVPRLIYQIISENNDDTSRSDIYDDRPIPVIEDFLDGARNIIVSGNYIYVASKKTGTNGGSISIIDITFPQKPYFMGGLASDETIGINSIFLSNNYIYACFDTGKVSVYSTEEITSPTFISSLSISSNSVEKINIQGKKMICATNLGELIIVDISDPENMSVIFNFSNDASSPTPILSDIQNIYVNEDFIYLVSPTDGLAVYKLSDLNTLNSQAASYGRYLLFDSDANGSLVGITSIVVDSGIGYATLQDDLGASANKLAILDLKRPSLFNGNSILSTYSFSSDTTAIPVKFIPCGRYGYALYPNSIKIIDISNFSTMSLVSSFVDEEEMSSAKDFILWGKYGFVAGGNDDKVLLFDLAGMYASTAQISNLFSNNLIVNDSVFISNSSEIKNNINIGFGGLDVSGKAVFGNDFFVGEGGFCRSNEDVKDFNIQGDLRGLASDSPVIKSFNKNSFFGTGVADNINKCIRHNNFLYTLNPTQGYMSIVDVTNEENHYLMSNIDFSSQANLNSLPDDFIIYKNYIFVITEQEIAWTKIKYAKYNYIPSDWKVFDFENSDIKIHPKKIISYGNLIYIGGRTGTYNGYSSQNSLISLYIYNLEDEDSLKIFSYYDDTATSEANDCQSLSAYNGYLYFACDERIIVYNISDSYNISRVSVYDAGVPSQRNYYDVYSDKFLLSAITDEASGRGIEILNKTNNSSITLEDYDFSTLDGDEPRKSVILGDTIYVANHVTSEGLSIYSLDNNDDISKITNVARTVGSNDNFEYFDIVGNNLYSVCSETFNSLINQDIGGSYFVSANFDNLKFSTIHADNLHVRNNFIVCGGISANNINVKNEVVSDSGFTGQKCCYVVQTTGSAFNNGGIMPFGFSLETISKEIDSPDLTYSDSFRSFIISKSGSYIFSYNIDVDVSGVGSDEMWAKLYEGDPTNGSVALVGSRYHYVRASGRKNLRGNIIINVDTLSQEIPLQSQINEKKYYMSIEFENPSMGSSLLGIKSKSFIMVRKIS